jgi:hypothetical protein
MSRISPFVATFGLLAFSSLGLLSACERAVECRDDLDCGAARVCTAGRCAECADNADCETDSFCCQGACRPEAEIAERCGCGPSPAANPGTSCVDVQADAVCLVGDAVATLDTVAEGACGCGCTPADGGPRCLPPEDGDAEPVCSCAENSDCRKASQDAEGRPHRVADTCTPQDRCVCFSLGASEVCDPDGATPDCAASGGCRSFVDDPTSCGVSGRTCTDESTGIADVGACVAGGCTCNDAADCAGAGLNVDTCAFVAAGEPSRCVCDAYSANGAAAACPMELACSAEGCVLDGVALPTQEALLGALGLPSR